MKNIIAWLKERKDKKAKIIIDRKRRAKKEAEEEFAKKYLGRKVIMKNGITGIMLKLTRFKFFDYVECHFPSNKEYSVELVEGIIQVENDKFIIDLDDICAIEFKK